MSDEKQYLDMLLEQIRDQNQAVLEAVGDIQRKVDELPTKDAFERLETKVDTIAEAVTDTNKDVRELDGRVARLKKAA